MGKTLAYKILENHLVEGTLAPGEAITIKIDQTLTQDSTGTMVYLQLEAMEVDKVKTELSVAYIDHNTLQTGFENADDHEFIKSVARRHGVLFSKPGNGICHQLQLENYGKPGKTLLGSDSHTPTGGGLGMIAIGAGGLDVAVAMAKGTYSLTAPKVVKVELKGALKPWVSAKDVILYVLQQLTVKGGVGKIIEYTGEGVKSLSVTDRATITNMGAELGATTSVFPSDENTRLYLKEEGRADTAGSDAAQPGQRGQRKQYRRDQGGSGSHRKLHELLLHGSDESRCHPQGQEGASGCQPGDLTGIQQDHVQDGAERCTG